MSEHERLVGMGQIDIHPDNPQEITHLAVVQVGGLCEDGSVTSRGFSSHDEAVQWVRDQVEHAHGALAYVWPSVCPFRYDLGADPQRFGLPVTWVMTVEGPTHGYVIATDYSIKIKPDNERDNL